jgi:hypothetical protein
MNHIGKAEHIWCRLLTVQDCLPPGAATASAHDLFCWQAWHPGSPIFKNKLSMTVEDKKPIDPVTCIN